MMELTELESRRSLDQAAPVPMQALLAEVAASARPAALARGLAIEVVAGDEAACVDGDAFLLRRAVANLVDNALDFSPAGGVVTMRLSLRPRSCDVVVRDHGPGIPEYAGTKVFEKFYSLARPATAQQEHRPRAGLRA